MVSKLISLFLLIGCSAIAQPWSLAVWGNIPTATTGEAPPAGECTIWQSQTNNFESGTGNNTFAFNITNDSSSPITICKMWMRVYTQIDTTVSVQLRDGYHTGSQYGSDGVSEQVLGWTGAKWAEITFAQNPVIPGNTTFWVCITGRADVFFYESSSDVWGGASSHNWYAADDTGRVGDPAFAIFKLQ